tara:strand:+ start:2243 stop:2392 length:150 start_codon:yes stop_codon:yes gene_type:complete
MIKNIILKKILPFAIFVFGIIYLVNYLDISPKPNASKKVIPNEIAVPIK